MNQKKLIVVFSPEVNSDFYNSLVINLEKRIVAANAIMSLAITGFDEKIDSAIKRNLAVRY